MFIHEKNCMYQSIAQLLSSAKRTGIHPNKDISEQIGPNGFISDSLLYVQSNGRIQVGHNEFGRMHYLSSASSNDFPLPTLTQESDQLISAQPGMYYQTDIAMLLGEIYFSLTLENGDVICAGDNGSESFYLDYFLPATKISKSSLSLTSFSIAPLLEPEVESAIKGLPIPGPSGAIHSLHIRNQSDRVMSINSELHLTQSFITQYQFTYQSMKEYVRRPFQSEWHQNALFMWRPDACALLQAQGFSHAGNPGMPKIFKRFKLKPGEETTLTCFIAISSDIADIHPAFALLYRHTTLEWINLAATFWHSRLGKLTSSVNQPLQQRAMDFHMRSVLDNFNCYHLNKEGELIAHLQGAPSQVSGRFWGIDAEPTALSLIYAIPELAGPILRFVAYRNRPAYSLFPEHSTPILMAPFIIAAKYFELTNDVSPIRSNEQLTARLINDAHFLLSIYQPTGLMPSRYSSDGHVFHRYDYGTNCKAYYVFSKFSNVLDLLGESDLAKDFLAAASIIKSAVNIHMIAEGPFGKQISGGTNLDEHETFYLRNDLLYYDGEDSSSSMAFLYGLTELDDPLWQNYHRFARSLFATNFDAEVKALRWFAWGHAIDGTAFASAMAGSLSRDEMSEKLLNLFDMTTDTTGAMFWWPRAKNYVRGLTRCNQAQGAWVFQNTEQWLGLRLDEPNSTIHVRPQGIYTKYSWIDARLGKGHFDIELDETENALQVRIRNKTYKTYSVTLYGRNSAELFSNGSRVSGVLEKEGELELSLLQEESKPQRPVNIEQVENRVFAPTKPALGTYLFELPKAYDEVPGVVILPFAILAGPKKILNAHLTVSASSGILIKPKSFMMLDDVSSGFKPISEIDFGEIQENTRVLKSFYVQLPKKYYNCEAWLTRASFVYLHQNDTKCELVLKAEHHADIGYLNAVFSWNERNEDHQSIELKIPIKALPSDDFDQIKLSIFGGSNQAVSKRLK